MGSHVNRGSRGNRGKGGGGGSSGGAGGGGSFEEKTDKENKYDSLKTQNKIDELLYSNKHQLASTLIVNTATIKLQKEALLSFLLTSVDILQASKKEVVNKFQIENSLNNATQLYHYSINSEDKERIIEIIKDNLLNNQDSSGGSD